MLELELELKLEVRVGEHRSREPGVSWALPVRTMEGALAPVAADVEAPAMITVAAAEAVVAVIQPEVVVEQQAKSRGDGIGGGSDSDGFYCYLAGQIPADACIWRLLITHLHHQACCCCYCCCYYGRYGRYGRCYSRYGRWSCWFCSVSRSWF
jgi:hypothetical protein